MPLKAMSVRNSTRPCLIYWMYALFECWYDESWHVVSVEPHDSVLMDVSVQHVASGSPLPLPSQPPRVSPLTVSSGHPHSNE